MPDHPLTPATVTINGEIYGLSDIIWAGLAWHKAKLRDGADYHLGVPWCHPDDAPRPDGDIFRVRPRDPRRRFVRGRSGAWVLRVVEVGDA